jgi:hypothetical protein
MPSAFFSSEPYFPLPELPDWSLINAWWLLLGALRAEPDQSSCRSEHNLPVHCGCDSLSTSSGQAIYTYLDGEPTEAVYITLNNYFPDLPDYTYTGYQPPCTVTTSGRVETLHPIVPASDSSLFFRSTPLVGPSAPTASATAATTVDETTTKNSAFATGIFAQALQSPTPVTPSTSQIISGGITTIISVVPCEPTQVASQMSAKANNWVCHASGNTTYSISGTTSVCCPNRWATTPLNSELFCFTSIVAAGTKMAVLEYKRGQTEALSGIALQLQDLSRTRLRLQEHPQDRVQPRRVPAVVLQSWV